MNNKLSKYFDYIHLAAIISAILYVVSLKSGNNYLLAEDWGNNVLPYLKVLKLGVTNDSLPYYTNLIIRDSTAFLGIAEVPLNPLLYLLKFISIYGYIMVVTFLNVFIGGLYSIKFFNKHRVPGILKFIGLNILFLNGQIIAHLAVGHFSWRTYFLFPLIFIKILELRNDLNIFNITILSLCSSIILLQGGIHQFLWILFVINIFYMVSISKRYVFLALFNLFTMALSAVRILPSLVVYTNYTPNFAEHYNSILDLTHSLLSPVPYIGSMLLPWEYYTYIGLTNVVFIIIFLVSMIKKDKLKGNVDLRVFGIIAIIFLLLSASPHIYVVLFNLGGPLLSTQRVSTRYLLMFLAIVAFIGPLSVTPKIKSYLSKFYVKVLIFLGSLSVFVNPILWNVKRVYLINGISAKALEFLTVVPVDRTHISIRYVIYENSFILGLVITLVSYVTMLIYLSYYKRSTLKK